MAHSWPSSAWQAVCTAISEVEQAVCTVTAGPRRSDRKSTRLNSSHTVISYAVFCLKKKRSEDLLGPHARAVGHVLEDRRLDEPALLVLGSLRPAAAVNHLGSAVDCILQLSLDLCPL